MSNTCFLFSKHFSIENSALAEITSQPYSIDSIRSDNKKAMLCVRLSATAAAAAQPFIYLVIYSLLFSKYAFVSSFTLFSILFIL